MEVGLFGRTNEAAFKSKMSEYKEQANMYVYWNISQTMNTDTSKINSGEILKLIIEEEIITDISKDDVSIGITEILTDINKEEEEYLVMYKGELCYVSNKDIKDNAKREQWCREIGIKILEYVKPTGIVVRNGNYELVKGIYLCTPKLDDGFDQEKTRYLEVGSNGSLIPGNWVTDRPTENWYDYGTSKWANIYVEDSGSDIYYVWIPRYCFKLDQEGERSDVKFIDVDNSYKDAEGDMTKWEGEGGLKEQKYQVPEAFTIVADGKTTELPGFWIMKYTAGDVTTPRFDTEVVSTSSSIRTKGITGSQVAEGQVYNYYINGVYKGNKTSATDTFEFANLQSNKKYTVLVEIRNSTTDAYIGTIVEQISTIEANKPVFGAIDTSTGQWKGFSEANTYYVLYDKEFNMTIGEKIKLDGSNMPLDPSKNDGKIWCDYSKSRWANIVVTDGTVENGQITGATETIYYTWIPRYEFMITDSQYKQPAEGRTEVRFLPGTSTETSDGYQIPEAFTFNGVQLPGYWIMKYTAG